MKNITIILLTFVLQHDTIKAQAIETKPFALGSTITIQSSELAEKRILNIYLPQGFSPDSTYPVIYLLDGSADEDYIHIVGLVQFFNFPWINTLPPSIVVGIANVDRKRDFTFPTTIEKDKNDFPTTGKSERFMAFIEKELQPFINTTYKTSASKTIIGQSLGGLLATEILFKKPTLFNTYIIISPSLWWDNESLLASPTAISQPHFNQQTKIYVGVGKEGKIMVNDAKKLSQKLKAIPNTHIQTYFEYFSKTNHANILHQAVYNAFQVLNK